MVFRSTVVALSAATFVFALSAVGCASKTSSSSATDGSLGTSEDALSTDNSESQDAEDDSEDGVENGLSGSASSDPGSAPDATDVAGVDAKVKTNPGLFFTPAGCIVSTRVSAGVWTHVFTNCVGPKGRVTYNGTITSTWTASAGKLEVKHASTDFSTTGPRVTATYSGSRDVTYTRAGTVTTKTRVGNWSGTLEKKNGKSEPWTHTANFTESWDSSSKCYTRDGSAENSIGSRDFGRTVSGFKVCGGLFACPTSGELQLSRKDGTVNITLTVEGAGEVEVTGPRGNSIKTKLVCDAS